MRASLPRRPGGVRTFPLLALAGGCALSYSTRATAAAFVAGLLVARIVDLCVRSLVRAKHAAGEIEGAFVVPACNLLAYVLGPLYAHAAALALRRRCGRSGAAARRPAQRCTTGRRASRPRKSSPPGQFLILVGVVLPLLAGQTTDPVHDGHAVRRVARSRRRFVDLVYELPAAAIRLHSAGATLLAAILGGLYSSTATTVVLARRARAEGMTRRDCKPASSPQAP